MKVALIVRDIGKNGYDDNESIRASVVVDTSIKQAIQAMPERDDLAALSQTQFRKKYPGRLFPRSTYTNSTILKHWIANIKNNIIVKTVEADPEKRGQYIVRLQADLYKKLKQLAEENNTTRNDLIEDVLFQWMNASSCDSNPIKAASSTQRIAYALGQIASLERDLTGNFNPDKYLIGNPNDKIKAVKAYAKSELTPEDFSAKFDPLNGLNFNKPIQPNCYGYFMAGFYGLDIGSIG